MGGYYPDTTEGRERLEKFREPIVKDFCKQVRAAMARKGLTPEKVAKKVGVTRTEFIDEFLEGQVTSLATILHVLGSVGLSIDVTVIDKEEWRAKHEETKTEETEEGEEQPAEAKSEEEEESANKPLVIRGS